MAMQSVAVQTSATASIVAAVAGKKIRVYGWSLSANGTVNVKFQSHVSPTDLTGLRYMVVNSVWDMPLATVRPPGRVDAYFETLTGEALDLNLSASIAVGGVVFYEIVAQ